MTSARVLLVPVLCAVVTSVTAAGPPPQPARCTPGAAEAVVPAAGGSTRLAGIGQVTWPKGAVPAGTRTQVAAVCSELIDGTFEETTAIFGNLERSRYAVRVAIARSPARPAVVRVSLAVPPEAGNAVARVYVRTVEGGKDERHIAFTPLDASRRDGQLQVTLDRDYLTPSQLKGYAVEAVFIIGWSRGK